MKITKIEYEKITLMLDEPIVIAFRVMPSVETIVIKVSTDSGIVGYGEAAPFSPVTGETLDSTVTVLKELSNMLVGKDPLAIEEIHHILNKSFYANSAAKAGIDIALYDIKGKFMNLPVYKVLGGHCGNVVTDITIGIGTSEEMAKKAKAMVAKGFRILKIKAGINEAEDVAHIKAIREAVGDAVRLRMDANQGWSVNSAIRTIEALKPYNVDAIEQALPHWDVDGHARIRRQTDMCIMLDESLHNPYDAAKIAKLEAADTFNIKLMKSGGLYPATHINAIGEAFGINCMVGCMAETRIAITAGASLVAALNNVTEADLDGFVLFESDNTVKGGFELEGDVIKLFDKPGLGVEVNF